MTDKKFVANFLIEREKDRDSKNSRKDRKRRSRSRSRDHRRRSRSRERRSDNRRRRSHSSEGKRKKEKTPQERLDEISKETGIKVPEYLAGSSNVKRNYLETQAKRKLLWSRKLADSSNTDKLTDQQKLWANLNVGDDKQTNKFQKLMGATKLAVAKDDSVGKQAANDLLRKQSTMFNAFDAQYRTAQNQTHFSKGKGFGQ